MLCNNAQSSFPFISNGLSIGLSFYTFLFILSFFLKHNKKLHLETSNMSEKISQEGIVVMDVSSNGDFSTTAAESDTDSTTSGTKHRQQYASNYLLYQPYDSAKQCHHMKRNSSLSNRQAGSSVEEEKSFLYNNTDWSSDPNEEYADYYIDNDARVVQDHEYGSEENEWEDHFYVGEYGYHLIKEAQEQEPEENGSCCYDEDDVYDSGGYQGYSNVYGMYEYGDQDLYDKDCNFQQDNATSETEYDYDENLYEEGPYDDCHDTDGEVEEEEKEDLSSTQIIKQQRITKGIFLISFLIVAFLLFSSIRERTFNNIMSRTNCQ